MNLEERIREVLVAYRAALKDLTPEHARHWASTMKAFEVEFDDEYGIEDHDTSWLV